jgi:hypothetical protein
MAAVPENAPRNDRPGPEERQAMTDHEAPFVISQGLIRIRRRRWLLWGTIVAYLPGLLLALELNLAGQTMAKLFAAWVGLLCVAVGLATVVKCPRCRQTYHTNGPTFLPVRKCLHCGLPLLADKARPDPRPKPAQTS